MSHRRIALAGLVAACLIAVAVPATASATSWTQRSNTASTDKSLDAVKKQLAELKVTVAKLDSQSGIVNLLAAAAPQLVDGLTQLKNGLTTLGDAYQSVEYGIAQVNAYGGSAGIVNPPSWSGDIPDDGNGATTSGTATIIEAGAGQTVTFSVNAYIRSNEANLTGATGPVGQAGATLTVRNAAGALISCLNMGASSGIAVTLPGETINTPTGPVRNLPLTNIRSAMARDDQTLPGGDAPQLASCRFAVPLTGASEFYTASFTASFLDIPTSSSPGPRD